MSEDERLNQFINRIDFDANGNLKIGLITLKRWIQEYGKRMAAQGAAARPEVVEQTTNYYEDGQSV